MKTEFTLPDDTTISYTRTFAAPAERVWQACTDPQVVRTWMLGPSEDTTFEVCDMDIREGGSFRWVWLDPDERLEIYGDVLEVDAPRRLVTTEQMGGTDWPPTHNVVELTEQDGRTVLTGNIRYPSKEARDGAYASGMADGMDVSFARLDEAA